MPKITLQEKLRPKFVVAGVVLGTVAVGVLHHARAVLAPVLAAVQVPAQHHALEGAWVAVLAHALDAQDVVVAVQGVALAVARVVQGDKE